MSGFLIRRTKKALAGWADPLTGRSENPPQQPWRPWGDSRTVILTTTGMVFGNDGGWFQPNPNGGMGYEHQPLTENWEVQFTRTLSNYNQDGAFHIYLDKNWTAGGSAGSTRYQTYLRLDRVTDEDEEEDGTTTTTITHRITLELRDTTQWIAFGGAGGAYTMKDATWSAALRVRVRVLRDKVVIVWLNDTRVLFVNISDSKYNFTGGQRSANFAQIFGPTNRITNFATRDLDGLRTAWNPVYYDGFDRSNSTSIGGGWSQSGGDFGIWNNAMSMQAPFLPPGDGHRGAWRGPAATRDMRVEVMLGGGTGDPNDISATYVVVRANASFTSGLAFRIKRQEIALVRFTGSATNPTFTEIHAERTRDIITNGDVLAFQISGDQAWCDLLVNGGSRAVFWTDAIGSLVGDNRYFGAILQRLTFTNSVPLNYYRLLDAA